MSVDTLLSYCSNSQTHFKFLCCLFVVFFFSKLLTTLLAPAMYSVLHAQLSTNCLLDLKAMVMYTGLGPGVAPPPIRPKTMSKMLDFWISRTGFTQFFSYFTLYCKTISSLYDDLGIHLHFQTISQNCNEKQDLKWIV